jgi:hypothetical protein
VIFLAALSSSTSPASVMEQPERKGSVADAGALTEFKNFGLLRIPEHCLEDLNNESKCFEEESIVGMVSHLLDES